MSYYELLRHPLWQKKRLEILGQRGWTCEICEEQGQELHVHHGYYEKGLKPWEYDENTLHVLCKTCHAAQQLRLLVLHRLIGEVGPGGDLEQLIGFAKGLLLHRMPHARDLESYEDALGIAQAWSDSEEMAKKIVDHRNRVQYEPNGRIFDEIDGWKLAEILNAH